MPGVMTLVGTVSALAGIVFIAKGDKERRNKSNLVLESKTEQV